MVWRMHRIFSTLQQHFLAPPTMETREQDIIQKTLNAIGVTYSHHNDEILVPSRIEEERTKKVLVRLDTPYRFPSDRYSRELAARRLN